MKKILLLVLTFSYYQTSAQQVKLPIDAIDRSGFQALQLTKIGEFGLKRKPRPTVPAHFHTGLDIKRPGNNYDHNPIFPIAEGLVISKRDDGPYAQLIIEHQVGGEIFWSVYEHIAGIKVELHDHVSTDHPIARFMNKKELNQDGWQFDHFHLEILKVPPIRLKANPNLPERHFNSYTLLCFSENELEQHFYDPIQFLQDHLKSK